MPLVSRQKPRSFIDSVRKSITLIERINQNCLRGDTVSTQNVNPKTRDGDKMNGLFLTGCFSARKPVGPQSTQRVGASRSENPGIRSHANTAPGLFNPLG
jgi:hypothetical protein